MVTKKKTAELCGVSRVAVDRARNDRGKIIPAAKTAIMDMARRLTLPVKPLAARKHKPITSVVMSSEGNAFLTKLFAA